MMTASTILVLVFVSLMLYTSASLCFLLGSITNGKTITKMAYLMSIAGSFSNLFALAVRYVLTGRLPLNNGAEFLLSFAWITMILFLVHATRSKSKNAGGIVTLIVTLLIGSILVMTPNQLSVVRPLVPALKSPWLTVHVMTAVFAYSGFALAFGIALMEIIHKRSETGEGAYRIVGTSFVILTATIIFGAIWAEQVWGRYWSWDPKETWALITWIIYAVYLHLYRQTKLKWRFANFMIVAGFIIVLFTYYGVNYLLPGLHSYS